MRKIIHIDMDAFFAAIEQRNNKNLIGKPVVVGGDGRRSVVAAASYEVRKFGVYSAMPMSKARNLCPNLIIVKPNFVEYRKVSNQVREIFFRYTDLVEPLSIDEAYLDVTDLLLHNGSATLIAKDILEVIKKETNLTASAGVSYNKFLAKYASNINKPYGIYVVTPEQALDVLANMKIEKFYGVGPSTTKKLHNIEVYKGIDLKNTNINTLIKTIGKSAVFYHNLVQGIDDREVKTQRVRRSIASERTFSYDLLGLPNLENILIEVLNSINSSLKKKSLYAKTMTVKIKYSDFKIATKSYTDSNLITNKNSSKIIAIELLSQFDLTKKVRLLGISYSNLFEKEKSPQIQLRLFD